MAERRSQEDITRLLMGWSDGDKSAFDDLVPLIYDRLRRLAASFLRKERAGHSLQTSDLVNEAFLRLVRQDQVRWHDRAHFFAIAGQMMRRILVDYARRHGSVRRGGAAIRASTTELRKLGLQRGADLVALDDALEDLEARDPTLARLVEMRYFGGLNKEQLAEMLGISSATVTRRWRVAKAWLYAYLVKGEAIEL